MKKIIRYVSLAILGWMAITGIYAVNREGKVKDIRVGITEEEVVALLGFSWGRFSWGQVNNCSKWVFLGTG